MTTGAGVDLIGGWFGTGPERGLALVFTITGVVGLVFTVVAMRTRSYRMLSTHYLEGTRARRPSERTGAADADQHAARI